MSSDGVVVPNTKLYRFSASVLWGFSFFFMNSSTVYTWELNILQNFCLIYDYFRFLLNQDYCHLFLWMYLILKRFVIDNLSFGGIFWLSILSHFTTIALWIACSCCISPATELNDLFLFVYMAYYLVYISCDLVSLVYISGSSSGRQSRFSR